MYMKNNWRIYCCLEPASQISGKSTMFSSSFHSWILEKNTLLCMRIWLLHEDPNCNTSLEIKLGGDVYSVYTHAGVICTRYSVWNAADSRSPAFQTPGLWHFINDPSQNCLWCSWHQILPFASLQISPVMSGGCLQFDKTTTVNWSCCCWFQPTWASPVSPWSAVTRDAKKPPHDICNKKYPLIQITPIITFTSGVRSSNI